MRFALFGRWPRRLLLVLAGVLLLPVGLLALLQLPPVATWAGRQLVGLAPLAPGARLDVGRVTGSWARGLALHDVALVRNGRRLATVRRVAASYDLGELLRADRRLRALIIEGMRVHARREHGAWDIAGVLQSSEDTSGGGSFALDRLIVRDASVTAELSPDSIARAEAVELRARDLLLGEPVTVILDTLTARVSPPTTPRLTLMLAASGAATPQVYQLRTLRLRGERSRLTVQGVLPRRLDDERIVDRLDVELSARPLALGDFAGLVPGVAPGAELELDARAGARGRRASGRVTGRLNGGEFILDGATLLGPDAPPDYRIVAALRRLDPSRLLDAAPAGRVNADFTGELSGPALDRSAGRAELRLWDSRIGETAIDRVALRSAIADGRATVDLSGAVAEGRIAGRGWVRPFDSVPSYRLSGTAVGLPGIDSIVPRLVGREGDPRLEVGFRLAGRGVSAAEARVDGRVELTAVRAGGAREPLGHATLALADRDLESRPELRLAGGRITASVSARLEQPVGYRVRGGTIRGVDLGRLLGDTVAAPLSGRFELTGTGTTPAEAVVRASLALDELRYGPARLEDAAARLGLDSGRVAVTLRGRLQDGRVTAEATARPFDSTPGYTVRRIAIDSVDLGTLLGRPDLAGPVTAHGTGTGRWGEAAKTLRGRLTVEPSMVGDIALHRGDVTVTLASGRLRYEGSLVTSGGSLTLTGDGRPLDPVPVFAVRRGRADSLDLGVLLGGAGPSTHIDARFSADARGATLDSLRAHLALELLPSRINQARLESARADLTLDRGDLRGDVRAQGDGAALQARLEGTVAASRRRLRAEGTLSVDRLAPWTGDTAVDGHVAARFTLDGAADSLGLLELAGTVSAEGAVDSVRLDTLQIALSPGERLLVVDTLVVRSNVATFDGGGRLALRESTGADTLRLAGVMLDPMPLVTLAGADSLSLDSARVRLFATGAADRRRLVLWGQAHRVLYAGSQVGRLAVDGAADLGAGGLAGAAGRVELEGASLGSVVVRQARLAGRYDSVVALETTVLLRDSIAVEARLRGTAVGDTVRGTVERLDLAEGGRRWALERPARFELGPGRYAVDYFALRAGERRLAIDGVVDRTGTSDLTAELRGFDLAPLHALGLVPVGGTAEADVRLTGAAAEPALTADLRTTVRPEEGEESGRIGAKAEWTRAGLRLDLQAADPEGARLTVAGTLPYRLTLAPADTTQAVAVSPQRGDTLGLAVRAEGFGLSFFQPFLAPGAVERITGVLVADGRISGTMESPRADGTLAVRDFSATLPALGVQYRNGEAASRLAGDRLTLERLRLVTDNDGTLTARGDILLAPLDDPKLDLTADLDQFRISHSATLRTIASGQLRLAGSAAEPVMTGSLTLGRTDIIVGAEGAGGASVEEVRLTDEDLRLLARDFGPAVLARASQGPGLVDRFQLDLDVTMPNRVWFRQRGNLRSDIEISGRVKLLQQPGEPMGFFGEVETVPGRGALELYGREFRLQEGEITLDGPAENVVLDVTAQYQVPTQADPGDEGILIDLNATGRPDSLKLDFSSDPSMSQEDIVSYIVTGRPASENPLAQQAPGEGAGAAEAGAEVALGRLSESVAGAAGEALGFDVFQIRPDGLRGLTLTAGRYVADRLFLSLQQPIQLSSDARGGSSGMLGPGFELEYTARRWLRTTLRGGNVPPRFFFRGRYAF